MFAPSPAEFRKVDRVQFGIVSPDELVCPERSNLFSVLLCFSLFCIKSLTIVVEKTQRRLSVCEVVHAETYDDRGVPKKDGLLDMRMGLVTHTRVKGQLSK
jgi:hypothetical protein